MKICEWTWDQTHHWRWKKHLRGAMQDLTLGSIKSPLEHQYVPRCQSQKNHNIQNVQSDLINFIDLDFKDLTVIWGIELQNLSIQVIVFWWEFSGGTRGELTDRYLTYSKFWSISDFSLNLNPNWQILVIHRYLDFGIGRYRYRYSNLVSAANTDTKNHGT